MYLFSVWVQFLFWQTVSILPTILLVCTVCKLPWSVFHLWDAVAWVGLWLQMFGFWFLLRSVEISFSPLVLVGAERNARQNKIAIHNLRSAPVESPTGSAIWMSFFSSFSSLGQPASVLCSAFICQPELLIIDHRTSWTGMCPEGSFKSNSWP